MHLSMHNWMRAEPIETTIARLAKYGYKSIEISGEPDIYDSKEVKALLDHYGLTCWGSVTLMLGGSTGMKSFAFRIWDSYEEALWHDAGLSSLLLVALTLTMTILTLRWRRYV